MAISRLKVWVSETLFSDDLNSEFDNLINNATSLVSPVTAAFDFDGQTITLDGAAATTVSSSAAASWIFTSGAKTGTPSTSGSVERFSAQTFTDSATAGSGTATSHVFYSIAQPTLAATNASVVTTDAATWYIAAAPANGTNNTITNPYALWVDAGNARFDGDIVGPSGALSIGSNTGTVTFKGSTIPQNSQSAAYTTLATDANKIILHPTADNNPRTFTIDSNANVPYPIGTVIGFDNQINTVSIAITADTLVLAGLGSTGTRTLAANGIAFALKEAATVWKIFGNGLT